ncbi:MAG: nicotinate-nucleotide diphosphorylase, partial [Pseudomonadales bacterium]
MDTFTRASIADTVAGAINEDLGHGDITAQLIPENAIAVAELVCRDNAVIAGQPWAAAVFSAIDPGVILDWQIPEGGRAKPNDLILICQGKARSILTAERTAMNFLQTLSAAA